MLSDGGSDLTGGIAKFCAAHPETLGFGDLPYQAALLLKKRLKDDERWCGFIKQATQTKFETLQTELAFLVPPTLRSKARYMNLQSMLGWAQRILTVLDDPTLSPPLVQLAGNHRCQSGPCSSWRLLRRHQGSDRATVGATLR